MKKTDDWGILQEFGSEFWLEMHGIIQEFLSEYLWETLVVLKYVK